MRDWQSGAFRPASTAGSAWCRDKVPDQALRAAIKALNGVAAS
jgi:hypothetical protein